MIKKGRFAVVSGKEYELISRNEQFYIVSKDVTDLARGFRRYHQRPNYFFKEVYLSELEDAYEVFPYVMLESHRFAVETVNQQTGDALLVTSNPFVQKKLQVKPYRLDEFMVEIQVHELTVYEEKIAILGFEEPLARRIF